jgi:ABC-type phosphate transport system substrate-binding protein
MGAILAGALALLVMALLAFGPAPQANAAFTTGKCAGEDITGRGASFARDAHDKVFIFNFPNVYCIGTPGFGAIKVTYESQGSGAGRLSMKVRGDSPRFGMTDEPPTVAEVAQMNAGTGNDPAASDDNPNDNGLIHVVPAAVGAVAPLVNFPNDCDPDLLPQAARTDDEASAADDALIRVRFTKAQFEGIWAKDPGFERWDDVFTELDADDDCDKPIIRVVRFDESGTSFTFKDYLNTIDGAEGWLTTFGSGPNGTQEWPEAPFGDGGQCGATAAPGSLPDATDQLTSACASGNDDLTIKLVATDGSVGYSDISTARNNSPSLAIDPAGGDNDVYWTQIQNGSGAFTEPTADPNGFRTNGNKGSNCQAANFSNVPATTLGDWSQVSGVNALVGYGICTFTYGLVFDDNADVWGNSPAEESMARTVKDYWQNALSDGAQGQLFSNDYAQLPADVLAIARAGINGVDWDKGEGAGSDPGGGNSNPGGGGNAGGSSTTPPPAPISNLFSLPRKSISSKTGQATVSVKIPGPGMVEMLGTASVPSAKGKKAKKRSFKKMIRVGRTVLNASKAGTYNLTLKPSGAAKRQLAKKGKLKVNLKITYTPIGGAAKASSSAVTLKLSKPKSKKKQRSGR